MTNTPISVRSTRLLIILNGFFWLAFGIITAVGAHPSFREATMLRWAMAIAGLLAAFVLVAVAGMLSRRGKLGYWLAVALLAALILAALTDEFGLADLVFVLITVVPLALLLKDRAWYLQPAPDREQ